MSFTSFCLEVYVRRTKGKWEMIRITDSNSTIAFASFSYLLKLRGLLHWCSIKCSLSFGWHIPVDLGHHDAELEKVRSLAIFLGPRDLTGLCSIAPALLQLPPLLCIALSLCFYFWLLFGDHLNSEQSLVHFYFTLQLLFPTNPTWIPRTKYGICIV